MRPDIRKSLTRYLAIVSLLGGWPYPCCSGTIDASSTLHIVVIKSRENAFYTPTLQGFAEGLKKREQSRGAKVDIGVVALSGSSDSDIRLVRSQVLKRPQLLVTLGTDSTRMAAEVKPDLPVLFSMILDPVNLGIVKSLDSPGDQFSGTTLLVSPGKQLDALLQACPQVHYIGVLYTDQDPTSLSFLAEARNDAKRLNVEIVASAVKPADSTHDALQRLTSIDALWLIADPASTGAQALAETLDYARSHHLPILGASSGTVHAGALLALSANLQDLGDVTAEMADHILDGTETPAQMRVRGPRRTLLSINLDAARALGIKIPDTMLHLADEVVDTQQESDQK